MGEPFERRDLCVELVQRGSGCICHTTQSSRYAAGTQRDDLTSLTMQRSTTRYVETTPRRSTMKRRLAALATPGALAAIAVVAAGCGGGGGSTQTTTSSATVRSAPSKLGTIL